MYYFALLQVCNLNIGLQFESTISAFFDVFTWIYPTFEYVIMCPKLTNVYVNLMYYLYLEDLLTWKFLISPFYHLECRPVLHSANFFLQTAVFSPYSPSHPFSFFQSVLLLGINLHCHRPVLCNLSTLKFTFLVFFYSIWTHYLSGVSL